LVEGALGLGFEVENKSFYLETCSFEKLLLVNLNGSIISAMTDSRSWKHYPSVFFSVKSAYLILRRITVVNKKKNIYKKTKKKPEEFKVNEPMVNTKTVHIPIASYNNHH
jgi:hypothetical protein